MQTVARMFVALTIVWLVLATVVRFMLGIVGFVNLLRKG